MGRGSPPTGGIETAATEPLLTPDGVPSAIRELASAPDVLPPGARLGDGRYTIGRLVGRGGMGSVYLATDEVLGKQVALKRVGARSASGLERLRDEVRHAQKVTHPNVCRTYDLEEVDGSWLVKMEYVAGETLAQRLRRGPLPVAEAVGVALAVCAGLTAAHGQGLVHRDLKPANIMIEAGTDRVVLMDFGLARAADPAGESVEDVSGTPDYMAPEQVRGRGLDGRADLYALGCVLHEMLTGERVFPRETAMAAALAHVNDPPPQLPRSVPRRVARVVARLLEKEPARRPPDAASVAAALAGPRRRLQLAGVLALAAVAAGGLLRASSPPKEWRPVIRELRPGSEEDAGFPAFSPDGKSIAYGSNRRGAWRAYVESLEDGRSRALGPTFDALWLVRWTRDGRALLTGDPAAPAYRIPVDGGPATFLGDGIERLDDCAGRLVFVRPHTPGCPSCQRIVVREADGAERDLLPQPAGTRIGYLRCDAAGARVAFTTTRPDQVWEHSDVWVAPLDGGAPRKVYADARPLASFHPDGRSLLVSLGREGRFNLWELPLDGRPAWQVTAIDGLAAAPDVSPDGRTLAFLGGVRNYSMAIFATDLKSGASRKLTTTPGARSRLWATPDGREVIAASLRDNRSLIVSVSMTDGEETVLASGDLPALSPDGEQIAYVVNGAPARLLVMPRRGGPSRTVAELPYRVADVIVGGDSRIHLCLEGPEGWEAWRVPLGGGAVEREAPAPWGLVFPAPAGGWRAAFDRDDAMHLVAPGAPLDDPRALTVPQVDGMRWDRDSASLVLLASGKVRRFAPATGKDTVLLEDASVKEAVVSPDDQTLYTVKYYGDRRVQLIPNYGDRPRVF